MEDRIQYTLKVIMLWVVGGAYDCYERLQTTQLINEVHLQQICGSKYLVIVTGAKHKSILEGQSTHPRRSRGKALSRATRKPKRIGNKSSIGIQNKAFNCPVCEIHVNSETQLKQVS